MPSSTSSLAIASIQPHRVNIYIRQRAQRIDMAHATVPPVDRRDLAILTDRFFIGSPREFLNPGRRSGSRFLLKVGAAGRWRIGPDVLRARREGGRQTV
jgi:hypothetical protein